jgi:hypothetical protein
VHNGRLGHAAQSSGDVHIPFGEGGSGHTGGIFGDGTDRLWMHRHGCVLQKVVGRPPEEYAVSLMNKPTVSFTDTTTVLLGSLKTQHPKVA